MPVPFEIRDNLASPTELSTPLLQWNAHTETATPMALHFEFYDNLDAAPDDFAALTETPRPCKLLNPNLQPGQYSLLTNIVYVVPVDYDDTEHLAVIWASTNSRTVLSLNRNSTICGTNLPKKRKNKCQMQLTISY